MNPIYVAAIGVVVTAITYKMAGNIDGGFLRLLGRLGAVVLGISTASAFCTNQQMAQVAGQYYFYGIVGVFIVSKIFGGSAKES